MAASPLSVWPGWAISYSRVSRDAMIINERRETHRQTVAHSKGKRREIGSVRVSAGDESIGKESGPLIGRWPIWNTDAMSKGLTNRFSRVGEDSRINEIEQSEWTRCRRRRCCVNKRARSSPVAEFRPENGRCVRLSK